MDRVFKYIKDTPWRDNIPDETVLEKAREAFREMTSEADYTKQRICYRLAGQSGTGKTTQLLPTVLESEKRRGNKPVVVAVRKFAKYHPNSEQLAGDKDFREKTNGFALKCLAATLKLLIENGYMILFDMTILHPDFEAFVVSHLHKHNYTTQYHIMAVNPQISNGLINKRANAGGGAEAGRIVRKESADYFNEVLQKGLEYLSVADKKGTCFVWTVFDKSPLYHGNLMNVVKPFEKGRAMIKAFLFPEDELREAKLEIVLGYLPPLAD